jgi:serine/threonine protein kinase
MCGYENQANARFCNQCGTLLNKNMPTGLLPSQTLLRAGRYSILATVGQGGMGAVYKALDLQLSKRVVAIKEMSQSGLAEQELRQAVATFTREAEMLARLKHRSLPHIYEQFEEGGRRYLVMEFIDGETLEERLADLRQQGRLLPVEQTLDIGRQVCAVLDHLHSSQPPIIFRDLKPANIMLNAQGQAYLIDFGIARFFKPGQAKDTVALGSPGYAPPEQYRQASSPRSDIYSLGATLYQMLSGIDPSQTPFFFPPFSLKMPALEQLVRNMVALDEKLRPANMQVVYRALERVAQVSNTRPAGQARPAARKSHAPAALAPVPNPQLGVYVVAAASARDQQIWRAVESQLHALLDGFSDVEISEGIAAGEDPLMGRMRAVDEARLILLLLSDDFLSSSNCMAAADRALDRTDASVLAVMLRPCDLGGSRLTQVKTVPEDAIAHLSSYAQEQRIVDVAKTIRRMLVTLMMEGHTTGPMNLLHWLLWQLYGSGRTSCPYFQIGHYALRHIRSAGLASAVIHLLDLQKERFVGEYLIGPLRCADLTYLLRTIAPSLSDPEYVQGTALRTISQSIVR